MSEWQHCVVRRADGLYQQNDEWHSTSWGPLADAFRFPAGDHGALLDNLDPGEEVLYVGEHASLPLRVSRENMTLSEGVHQFLDCCVSHLTEEVADDMFNVLEGEFGLDSEFYRDLSWQTLNNDMTIRLIVPLGYSEPLHPEWPQCLRDVLTYARQHGCWYVQFDPDAEELSCLPTYGRSEPEEDDRPGIVNEFTWVDGEPMGSCKHCEAELVWRDDLNAPCAPINADDHQPELCVDSPTEKHEPHDEAE